MVQTLDFIDRVQKDDTAETTFCTRTPSHAMSQYHQTLNGRGGARDVLTSRLNFWLNEVEVLAALDTEFALVIVNLDCRDGVTSCQSTPHFGWFAECGAHPDGETFSAVSLGSRQ